MDTWCRFQVSFLERGSYRSIKWITSRNPRSVLLLPRRMLESHACFPSLISLKENRDGDTSARGIDWESGILNSKRSTTKGKTSRLPFGVNVACVGWRFWLGALNNKGRRGQRNREEIGAGATWKVFIFLAASLSVHARFWGFAAQSCSRQNRHATQASVNVTVNRKVKHHVYVKRQTRICTTWPSFLFTCRFRFITSTHKLVVSHSLFFHKNCFDLFLYAHFLFWEILNLNLTFAVYVKLCKNSLFSVVSGNHALRAQTPKITHWSASSWPTNL